MDQLRNQLQTTLDSAAISLVDSGEGERLEQFGERLIRRPSSLAIWKRRETAALWDKADARYIPPQGWVFRTKPIENWIVDLGAFTLKLIPQENGQTGLFPEHLIYFSLLSHELERLKERLGRPPRVLNLFAYTGMATVWCALHGADVTHIELSKRILTWARENLERNSSPATPGLLKQCRFIPEDAVVFLEREVKRDSRYDLIISDPPSFSRISKSQSWDLEDIIVPHIEALIRALNPEGTIFLTSHHQLLNSRTLENLFLDIALKGHQLSFEAADLSLQEKSSPRKLTCGSLLVTRMKSGNN